MVGEKVSASPISISTPLEGVGGCDEVSLNGVMAGVGLGVRGLGDVVGPEADFLLVLQTEERMLEVREQPFVPVEVGSNLARNGLFPLVNVGPRFRPRELIGCPCEQVGAQFELGLCPSPFEATVEVLRGAQLEPSVVPGAEVEGNRGVKGLVVLFEISESCSTGESLHVTRNGTKKRKMKKPGQKGGRLGAKQATIPIFPKMAMLRKSADKRGKVVNPKKVRSKNRYPDNHIYVDSQIQLSSASIPPHQMEEQPGIDLLVVLPLHSSCINHVIDDDGVSVSEAASEKEEASITKMEEAKLLIGIQKEVGFTFKVSETEIQSRLVDLDVKDRAKNEERVQQDSYQ
ncbi:hypothetical protein TSUD_301790 [Trifolium subterraneum]|uniref:Uncharacterized protein n=1 Tax=Trifolium subterraneum TaxID=3900 RepID=A0A2Z6NXK0_TRISU|nr:hypothetical protein TSUD_301790 [Trifolium subterraneum]